MSHNRLSWRRLFTTMNAAQERFTTKNTVRIGQPEAAHTKGSPVIEWIPLLRSSGIAQLGDTAIRYQIEPSRFAASKRSGRQRGTAICTDSHSRQLSISI